NAVWRQPTPQETVEIVSYASTLCAIGTQQARILEVWCVVQTFPSAQVSLQCLQTGQVATAAIEPESRTARSVQAYVLERFCKRQLSLKRLEISMWCAFRTSLTR
ncbi:hypothetical protein, partial [Xanthomonas fragariae]